jgi:hypothetical protein
MFYCHVCRRVWGYDRPLRCQHFPMILRQTHFLFHENSNSTLLSPMVDARDHQRPTGSKGNAVSPFHWWLGIIHNDLKGPEEMDSLKERSSMELIQAYRPITSYHRFLPHRWMIHTCRCITCSFERMWDKT